MYIQRYTLHGSGCGIAVRLLLPIPDDQVRIQPDVYFIGNLYLLPSLLLGSLGNYTLDSLHHSVN